jgi:hypothetical protein
MKVGVVGASGYAGVELLRLCAGHPDLEVVVATAGDRQWPVGGPATRPPLAAAYPNLSFAPHRRRRPSSTDSTSCFPGALPHGRVPAPGARPPAHGPGSIVDLAADFRLRMTRRSIRRGTDRNHTCRTRAPRWNASSTGFPELHREPDAAGPELIAGPGVLPDGGPPGPRPPAPKPGVAGRGRDRRFGLGGPGAPNSRRRHRSWTPPVGSPGPVGRPPRASTSARSTRTSSPTGSSTTATPPRWSRAWRYPGAVHAPPRSRWSRGHPGHLLRAARSRIEPRPRGCRHAHHRGGHGRPPPGATTASPSSSSPTEPPSTKATSGSNCAHVTVRVDPAHRVGPRPRRPRQPGQGGSGTGRAVRQPGPRPARGRRAPPWPGCLPVSITVARRGFVACRPGLGHQGLGRPRPGPAGHRRRSGRCPPPATFTIQPGGGRAGAGSAGPTWPPAAAGPSAVRGQQRQRQRRHRRPPAGPTPSACAS